MTTELLNSLQEHGIPLPQTINYDGFTRWGPNSCYWAVRLDGYSNWAFGDWRTGREYIAFKSTRHQKTPQQVARAYNLLKAKQVQDKITQKQETTARLANAIWNSLSTAEFTHPYLLRKQIEAHGIRIDRLGGLKIPLYDENGKMWNIQNITADGQKRFLGGGRKKGCFYPIGNLTTGRPIIITEGFATGASVYEATKRPVCVAFDCGNLIHVARALITKYNTTDIIIAADNDWEKTPNAGRKHAAIATRALHIKAIIPPISTPGLSDFNDIHCTFGLNKVRNIIETGIIK